MKMTIKDAADSLLKKGKITQEEYSSLEKTSGFSSSMETLGKHINTLWPLAALIGAGAVVKEGVVDPIVSAVKINNSYNQLIEKTPQLAEEDQEKIRDYFNIVKTYSPHAAQNPLVAGALVNKMVQWGGVDHKLVQDIAAIQEGRPSFGLVQSTLQEGTKTLSGKPKKAS